jgi:glycosyltransferase involved in cell wall biosynthesis
MVLSQFLLNLGVENASGEIVAFLDDDAIPSPNWLRSLIETYGISSVGGVAGDVITAFITEEGLNRITIASSQIVPEAKPFMQRIGRQLWDSPLAGLEDYLVYVSKAGVVSYNFDVAMRASYQTTKSLLGMGANMSVLTKALDGFKFPDSWALGLSNEQFLGWHIWKKGYNLLFNPHAKVYHLVHGQSMSREVSDNRRRILVKVEERMLFYRLYGLNLGFRFCTGLRGSSFPYCLKRRKSV